MIDGAPSRPAAPEAPAPAIPRPTADIRIWQTVLGALCWLGFLPFLRRVQGFAEVPRGPHVFVVNHVSLLDTLLLGGLFWSRRRYPILVLGDRNVWSATFLHRFLASKVGYLIDRDQPNLQRIEELRAFARGCDGFQLLVFPEGTRGDGKRVGPCRPGVYYVAHQARVPVVPVFLVNMQLVSSKRGGFHPWRGWRRIEVRFGQELLPDDYLALERDAFVELVRSRIQALASPPSERAPLERMGPKGSLPCG